MGIETLYPVRIGVHSRTWDNLPEPITPHPVGKDVEDAGPRAGMTLKRARDTEFLRPAIVGLPRGSSWCSDLRALDLRISQATAWRSYLKGVPSSPLAAVEAELAGKLTLQRGAAAGWDVLPQGLGLPGGGGIDRAMALIGDYLIERFPPTAPQWTPIPRGTNSGAPTYATSDIDKLFHALVARTVSDWDSAERAYSRHRSAFQACADVHALMFSRTGPVGKPLAMYDWVGNAFSQVATATSVAPRRRAVFGVPAFINIALLGWANIVKYAVMRTPWTSHPTESIVMEGILGALTSAGRGAVLWSDDISAFDQSVRRAHQVSLATHVYARYWAPETLNLWLGAQKMPILGPPLTSPARGFMYERPLGGVTTSGIITTSLDGTLINLARTVTAVARALDTSVERSFSMLLANRWGCRVWGDDTVLILPAHADMSAYTAANLEMGFATVPSPGGTFLMKSYDIGRRAVYPLATRAFQQTVWNEKGGRTAEIELLGLYVRTAGFEANPFYTTVWPLLLTDAEPIDRYEITSRMRLGQVISDPGFRDRLQGGLIENRSVIAEWLARSDRGHTEDGAVLGWVEHLFGSSLISEAKLPIAQTLRIRPTDAAEMASQLGGYLSTPLDDRPSPPGWAADLITPPTTQQATSEADDTQSTATIGDTK